MERTVNSIISEMEATGIMIKKMMTAQERLSGLLDYQNLVLKEVFNDDHAKYLRLKDVSAHIEEMAHDKGLQENEIVKEAMADMEIIAKEIAIAISGVSGERAVEKALSYVNRSIYSLSNISMSDDENKTEYDQIVITSSGIMILEVKNYKKDITISEAGQIYGPFNKHYSDKTLGEQMNLKRFLLREKLKKIMQEKQMEIDIPIVSQIVFSDSGINVTDFYKQENYCFKSSLPHVIDQYDSQICLSEEEMKIVESMIVELSDDDNTYEVGIDFDKVRKVFAEALILLETTEKYNEEQPKEEAESTGEIETVEPIETAEPIEVDSKKKRYRFLGNVAIMALAVAVANGIVKKL